MCDIASSGDRKMIPKLLIKTDSEIENCTKIKNQCQNEFNNCLEPLFDCIQKCTTDLRLDTLEKYDNSESMNL